MSTLEFVLPEGSPDPCPNACGRLTEDPYGGPCKACWDAVGRVDDDDHPRCTLVEGMTACYCTSRPGCQRPDDEDEDDDGWCEGDDGICDDPYCCAPPEPAAVTIHGKPVTTVDTGGLT